MADRRHPIPPATLALLAAALPTNETDERVIDRLKAMCAGYLLMKHDPDAAKGGKVQ